mmetsp:Transcript_6660/g.15967  ORF Transcript_6660/g.15967 Transcript_6660/m.15967 type:complete len:285 (-) Transcript_6660:142-996(-)
MPQASIGSKPSSLMTPRKSPLWISVSLSMTPPGSCRGAISTPRYRRRKLTFRSAILAGTLFVRSDKNISTVSRMSVTVSTGPSRNWKTLTPSVFRSHTSLSVRFARGNSTVFVPPNGAEKIPIRIADADVNRNISLHNTALALLTFTDTFIAPSASATDTEADFQHRDSQVTSAPARIARPMCCGRKPNSRNWSALLEDDGASASTAACALFSMLVSLRAGSMLRSSGISALYWSHTAAGSMSRQKISSRLTSLGRSSARPSELLASMFALAIHSSKENSKFVS